MKVLPVTLSVPSINTNSQIKSPPNQAKNVPSADGGGDLAPPTDQTGPPKVGRARALSSNAGSVGNYIFIKTIGQGNFAKVKLAEHRQTREQVAIKIIDKKSLSATSLSKLFREVRIMKMLDHPNIIRLYDAIDTTSTLYLIMEYASGGELFDYLVAHGKMKEREARIKFRQIISAMQYCHRKQIIHRDLKAENLLLDADMNIKIADFGFSNQFQDGGLLDTFCGSPPYAAPELFQGQRYEGPEVDIWSLGVILYTLVSGSLPFDGTSLRELREKVIKGQYRVPFFISADCEDFLKCFLQVRAKFRSNIDQIMAEKWMNIGFDDNPLTPYKRKQSIIDAQKAKEPPKALEDGVKMVVVEKPPASPMIPIIATPPQCNSAPASPARRRARATTVSGQPQAPPLESLLSQGLKKKKSTRATAVTKRDSNGSGNMGPQKEKAKPRVLRFTFSMNTTSTKEPEEVMEEIQRVLKGKCIQFELLDAFTIVCTHCDNKQNTTQWEMEVCRLSRLNMNGVRFKRLAGNSVNYKNIVSSVITAIHL